VDLAVLLIHRFDSTDVATWDNTRSSVVNVLSLQWNSWVASHPLAARADLSSLWFFSVATQLVLLLAVLVMVAGKYPRLLLVAAVLVSVAVVASRPGQLESQGWYPVALSTVGRSDAFFLGVVAALARRPSMTASSAGAVIGGVGLLLTGAVIGSSFVTVTDVFAVVIPVIAALTALFAYAAERDPDPRSLLVQVMSAPEADRLGSLWPYVLGWSSLVAVTLARHGSGSAPPVFLLGLGCVIVAVLALANQRVVLWFAGRSEDLWGRWRGRPQVDQPTRISL
jgi:peptidoglycan/LPS O-acetylase OafA/YrhL